MVTHVEVNMIVISPQWLGKIYFTLFVFFKYYRFYQPKIVLYNYFSFQKTQRFLEACNHITC